MQFSPIILAPGFFVGKRAFLRGFLLMISIEILLSIFVVGFDNIWRFIRVIYVAEITHSISDLDDLWYSFTFTGMLDCLPWFISSAAKIGQVTYVIICISILALWAKTYPALRKVSNQSIELMASLTTIPLVVFSLHGCFYDYLLFIFPCLWLYIWSTTDDADYTLLQSVIRLILSLVTCLVPFLYWDSLVMQFGEHTITAYQLRYFLMAMVLLACAAIALLLEFRKPSKLQTE